MVVMVIRSQKIEEHVFKERGLLRNKNVVAWVEEEKMRKTFVEVIQQLHVATPKRDQLTFPTNYNITWVWLLNMEVHVVQYLLHQGLIWYKMHQ
jgi:hypothetical protein